MKPNSHWQPRARDLHCSWAAFNANANGSPAARARAWSGWPAHARPWAGWPAHGRMVRAAGARARTVWLARTWPCVGWPASARADVCRLAKTQNHDPCVSRRHAACVGIGAGGARASSCRVSPWVVSGFCMPRQFERLLRRLRQCLQTLQFPCVASAAHALVGRAVCVLALACRPAGARCTCLRWGLSCAASRVRRLSPVTTRAPLPCACEGESLLGQCYLGRCEGVPGG